MTDTETSTPPEFTTATVQTEAIGFLVVVEVPRHATERLENLTEAMQRITLELGHTWPGCLISVQPAKLSDPDIQVES